MSTVPTPGARTPGAPGHPSGFASTPAPGARGAAGGVEVLVPAVPAPLSPGPEALAAIVAAVLEVWPRDGAGASAVPKRSGWHDVPAGSWRFSGRWWARPAQLRRERPS